MELRKTIGGISMITFIRWIRLWQLKTKWQFSLLQFIDKQMTDLIKNPEVL